MRFLAVLPYYGSHHEIEKLYTSLGVTFPGYDAIAQPETVTPFPYGDIYLRNNNFENIGYTRACNMGIRYALDHGYDAIWLLTDDIEVVDVHAAVKDFEKELKENPKAGIIGCQICFKEDPDFIYHGGTLRSFPTGLHKHGSVSSGDYADRSLERWAPGGSVVVSRRCAQDIGVMDENFFNIGSDSDYGFRARLAGYDVVYLPVKVLHPRVSMTSSPSPAQEERLQKDIAYFSEKWVTGGLFKKLEHGPVSYSRSKVGVSAVVSYCSLDEYFLSALVGETRKFASEIIIVAFDHLLNGDPENFDRLQKIKNEFPEVEIVVVPWKEGMPARYWHNGARFEGALRASEPWVLFLDGDEIPDGEKVREFLDEMDTSRDGYLFGCYWYFREAQYRAKTLAQCALLLRRKHIDRDLVFAEEERRSFRNRPSLSVEENSLHRGEPVFHHFSWARPKEALLKKVSSWGHKDDRDWNALIEEEFSAPFRGSEKVHGFEYEIVPNRFNIYF